MNSSKEIHVDPNAAFDPFATPNPSLTPQSDLDSTITITLGMWNHLINRLSVFETRSNNLERALEALDSSHNTLKNRHNTLEHEYYEQAVLTHRNGHQEPKIPHPPMFSGERKQLLPFLTKCQIKFDGQPSRFPNERCKILYAASRLEGPAFSWFLSELGMIGRHDRHGRHVWRAISDSRLACYLRFTSSALPPIVADIPFLFVAGIP